jgi:chromate transporter
METTVPIDGETSRVSMIEQLTGAALAEAPVVPSTLREFLLYFLRLGTLGFGGPIALAGHMQKDMVEDRRWISKQDYIEGLALAQLMPGPLAAQLAMYLGWVRARVLGATLVSAAFILPSFLMTVAIAAAYLQYGGLGWIQGAFYGIGAAVIAIIARSAWKLTRLSPKKDRLLWAIFTVTGVITAVTESEIVWLFLGAGVLAILVRAPPRLRPGPSAAAALIPVWIFTGLAGPQPDLLWRILGYFAAAGAFVFGSGLAIVPFLHGGVVNEYHWLTERQFLDAVAVAMITPGPVVITVAFIGYLVAGPAGSFMAGLGVFLPTYLFVVIPAPYYRRIAHNVQIQAFVAGVTAAASGAIVGAAFVLGRRAIVDVPTVLVAAATLLVLVKAKKVPEPLVILAAAVVGVVLRRGGT